MQYTCNKSWWSFLLSLSKLANPPVKEICHQNANKMHRMCHYISIQNPKCNVLKLAQVTGCLQCTYTVCKLLQKVQNRLDRSAQRTSMCCPSSTNCHARSVQLLAAAAAVRFTSLCQPRSATWPYIGVGDASVSGLRIRELVV